MRKTALAVTFIFTAFTMIPAYANPGMNNNNGKKSSEILAQSPGFSPPGLAKKNIPEPPGKLKKVVDFLSVDISDVKSDARQFADYIKSITDRLKDRPSDDFNLIRSSKSKDVKKRSSSADKNIGPNGDPKTTYHRWENKYHSAIHRPVEPPVDPPTEPPTEPPVDPPTDMKIDLSVWPVANQFVNTDGSLHTYYLPPEGLEEPYDYILVVQDAETEEFIRAESVSTFVVTVMPSLDGLTLVTSTQSTDGSKIDTYLLLESPTDSWSAAKKRVKVYSDPFGSFIEAEIREIETLSLDEILLIPSME